jgi:hypothetical protein
VICDTVRCATRIGASELSIYTITRMILDNSEWFGYHSVTMILVDNSV